MSMITAIILSLVVTPLFADEYEDNLKQWERFIDSNQWGSSSDFWLEKKTSYGWEKVILVLAMQTTTMHVMMLKPRLKSNIARLNIGVCQQIKDWIT